MNKENKEYLLLIFKKIFKQKKLLISWTISIILTIILSTINPFISAKIITSITNYVPLEIVFFLTLALIIEVVNSIIDYFVSITTERLENDIILNLKTDISKVIYNLEVKNFDKEGTGLFSDRINQEPQSIAFKVYSFRYSLTNLIGSLGVYIYLFIISWKLTILVILMSIILVIVEKYRIKINEKHYNEMNNLREDRFSDFNEFIRGIRDIKILNIKDYIVSKIHRDEKYITDKSIDHMKKTRKFYKFIATFDDLSTLIIIISGIYFISAGDLAATNLIVIYMYLSRALGLGKEFVRIKENISNLNISLSRITELSDNKKFTKETFGNKNIKELKGNIEFNNVKFEYEKDIPVLNNVNFKINKNTTIGFVGESGQGKSTIFNILSKQYQVKDNSILIDGYDINELSEQSIRENISVITQNPYLFNTTIRENLKMVNQNITDLEIEDILIKCKLKEYIDKLEKGLDTKIGEGGTTLSGGLKQRLAIARALVKDSNIILLDEATSSLDNSTQKYLSNSIKNIGENKTILIIAHRLSTIIKCDTIFVIDKGSIVDSGNHQYLMKNCEKYKELYEGEKF